MSGEPLRTEDRFPVALRGFRLLALLLLGSILLAGCSGGRDSGPEWSFEAERSQEEENPGDEGEGYGETAGSSGAGAAATQSASDSVPSGGAGAEGTAPAGSDFLGGPEKTAEAPILSGGAGALSADTGFSGVSGETAAVSGSPDGAGPVNAGSLDGTGMTAFGAQEPGYVYICGAVRSPGVYEIGEGTRVFEVIEQAGGLTKQADAEWLNQAEIVADGQKIQIYTKKETAAFKEAGLSAAGGTNQGMGAGADGAPQGTDLQTTAGGGAAAQEAAGDDKVNINTADKDLLMTLPGIGESKAEAILQYRQEHGNFGLIDDICQVSGIKEAVFSRIKDRITV